MPEQGQKNPSVRVNLPCFAEMIFKMKSLCINSFLPRCLISMENLDSWSVSTCSSSQTFHICVCVCACVCVRACVCVCVCVGTGPITQFLPRSVSFLVTRLIASHICFISLENVNLFNYMSYECVYRPLAHRSLYFLMT
jgi:hypothetical protein